jgi:hypothetical protein
LELIQQSLLKRDINPTNHFFGSKQKCGNKIDQEKSSKARGVSKETLVNGWHELTENKDQKCNNHKEII